MKLQLEALAAIRTMDPMRRKISFILIGALIVACYAVPYLVLQSVETWHGSFLFWTIAGVGVIVLNVVATIGFRGDAE